LIRILINNELCKGCNYCITFCPMKVFKPSSNLSKRGVYPPEPAYLENCNACGVCELFCPDFAVIVEKEAS